MAFIAKKNTGGFDADFPVGTQQAVIQSLIQLGTHMSTFNKAEPKKQTKVLIRFELPAHVYEREGERHVRTIYKQYTVSTHEQSHMYKLIGAAIGRPLTPAEQDGDYNYLDLVGKNLFVVIEQYAKTDGNPAYKITLEAPMPDAMPKVGLFEASVLFDLEPNAAGQIVIPQGLPKWAVEEITTSEEYQAWLAGQAASSTGRLPMPSVAAVPAPVKTVGVGVKPAVAAPIAAPVAVPAATPFDLPAAPVAPATAGGIDLNLLPPELRASVLERIAQVQAGLTVAGA